MDRNTNARLTQANATSAQTGVTGGASVSGTRARAAAPAGEPPPPAGPDISAMIRRVFAHWPVIVVAMMLGAIITTQVVKRRKPTFKSETVIFYREGIGKAITGPTDSVDALRTLGTKLKETLLAQQTLRRVIEEFKLYPDIVQKSGYAEAVDQMRKKTEFKSRSQDTFAISFEGNDKDVAQKVCTRMAELLIAENLQRQKDDNRGTTEFLEAEKKRADEELDRIERELTSFLHEHPEFADAKDGFGTEVRALKQKEQEGQRARRNLGTGRLPGKHADAPAPGGGAPSPPAVDPLLVAQRQQAMSDLLAAKKDLSDKLVSYTEQHPAVRAAQERVAAAEAAVQRAEAAITAAAPKEEPPPRKEVQIDDPYGDQKKPAPKALDSARADAPRVDVDRPKPRDPDQGNKVVSLELEWSRLTRTLGLARTRQADLETKLYRAEMIASTADNGYAATIAVLDPAYKPSAPSNAPNKTVVMIGLGASVVVGVVLSAAWGLFLDDRLFSASEIEGSVLVPVLGVVPRGDDEKKKKKGKAKDEPKGKATRG
jgi:uncharacterized protein involved in exopolysaccharide biosynthesis